MDTTQQRVGFEIFTGDHEDPYGPAIATFLKDGFPAAKRTSGELLEELTKAFVATGQVRYGPAPGPESLVAIRRVLRSAIKDSAPVPVLVAWGSRKPSTSLSVDVAEYSAARQLQCLRERVMQVYPPGIQVNVRIEDVSGMHLFQDDPNPEEVRAASMRYVADIESLLSIVGQGFVHPLREGMFTDEASFNDVAARHQAMFLAHLEETEHVPQENWRGLDSSRVLQSACWLGEISLEQRAFYYARFARLYPGEPMERQRWRLAKYLSGVLARRLLKANGDDPTWKGEYLRVSFATPVPGVPESVAATQLNYRTVLACHGMNHVPPWRAKGYLRVEEGRVIPKVASSSQEAPNLRHYSVRLSAGEHWVMVRTDYAL